MKTEVIFAYSTSTLQMQVVYFGNLNWTEPTGPQYVEAKRAVHAGDFATALRLASEANPGAKFRVETRTDRREAFTLESP